MTAYGNLDIGFAGLKQGIGDSEVTTRIAAAELAFGKPCFVTAGGDGKAYPFVADRALLTFSADFSASNSTVVTVNGVATVAEVYASSHAATFAAVVAKVEALTGVDVVESSATNRTILIQTAGVACVASAAVTGGTAVTATASFPGSVSRSLVGVTMSTQKEGGTYLAAAPANVLVEGDILVVTADAVGQDKSVYLTSAGAWTDESSGNMATPYFFRSSTSGAGLARIQLIKKPAA